VSQERWDVVLRYLTGPLARQPDQVCRGPVIRMGANPGPGGVKLAGYRGLDGRHAVITAYDGGSVAVAPVGNAQIRIAPHPNIDWEEVQVIAGPTYLSEGCAVHLGAATRGITFTFVEARRLGVWEERRILSESSQAAPEVQPTDIEELSTRGGIPTWFIGGVLMIGMVTVAAVLGSLYQYFVPDVAELGPIAEGREYYGFVSMETPVDSKLRDGLQQPFEDFVMRYNAEAAKSPALANKPHKWDQVLFDQVTRSFELHAKGWLFFEKLEQVADEYSDVVRALRKAGMPEVLAAVPYQESRYDADIQSPVCGKGYWQFMPETAKRMGLEVQDCRFKGSNTVWSPTNLAPPLNVRKRAQYVKYDPESDSASCRIKSCAVDERTDLRLATQAAIELFKETWADRDLQESGALVQLTITAHNTGYDDSPYAGRKKKTNVLPAYLQYLEDTSQNSGPAFLGETITCKTANFENKSCGGYFVGETQHYAYNIIAQHFLAVCYYGLNHGEDSAFEDWKRYVRGDGYCSRTANKLPTSEEVRKRIGQ